MDEALKTLQQSQGLVADRLLFSIIHAEHDEEGFHACLKVDIRDLPSTVIESLCAVFTGQIKDPDTYLIVLSDNLEQPIRYDSEEGALMAAAGMSSNIFNRYLYGLFSTYGVTPVKNMEKTPTVHFIRHKS